MPSLLAQCPACGAHGPAGDPCPTPACAAQGRRLVPPPPPGRGASGDHTVADGSLFDLDQLRAQFADIPDPEEKPGGPPPPPRRPPPPPGAPPRTAQAPGRRHGQPASPPAPPPAARPAPPPDDAWVAQAPAGPRPKVERTLLVEPIRDDEDDPLRPKRKGEMSRVLTFIMVLASLALLAAVIWLMLNPPAPSNRRSEAAPAPQSAPALAAAPLAGVC